MKKNIFKFSTLGLIAAFAITGCNKIDDFGDTNSNPNQTGSPITAAFLTNVQSNLGEIVNGIGTTGGTRGALYCQYISETQYTDASLYALPQLASGGLYSGILQDCQSIININSNPATAVSATASGSNANQIAVAKILKSYIFWTITDQWGDVPYSQALSTATFYPKYDLQEDIYKGILADLTSAVSGFDNGPSFKGDVIYAGDNTKWKKLANTLRMLVSLRMSKVYPAAGGFAATEFAAAANDAAGIITSNADNFIVPFPGGSYKNTWFNNYDGRNDYAESKTLGDALLGLGDGRQSAYGTNTTFFPYGLTRDLAIAFDASVNSNYSKVLAASKRAENSPAFIITASQSLLGKAEGMERGWISAGTSPNDAEGLYNQGVTASFAQWGASMSGTYLTSGAANYQSGVGVAAIGQAPAPYDAIPAAQNATTTTKLQRIALQRWLAAYPNGVEGWSEWRRTGIPDLRPTRFKTNANGIPRRFVYGVNEYSLNPDQVKIAAARYTLGDTQDSRVWWDKP